MHLFSYYVTQEAYDNYIYTLSSLFSICKCYLLTVWSCCVLYNTSKLHQLMSLKVSGNQLKAANWKQLGLAIEFDC